MVFVCPTCLSYPTLTPTYPTLTHTPSHQLTPRTVRQNRAIHGEHLAGLVVSVVSVLVASSSVFFVVSSSSVVLVASSVVSVISVVTSRSHPGQMHDLLVTRLQLSSKEANFILELGNRPLMLANSTVDLCVLIGNRLGVLVDDPEPLLMELELRLDFVVLDVLLERTRLLGVVPLLKVAERTVEDKPLRVCLLQEVNALDLADRQLVKLPADKVLHDVFTFPGARKRASVDAGDIDGKLGVEISCGGRRGGSGSHLSEFRA